MSTAGIVIITVILCLLLVLIVGAAGLLAWLLWQVRKLVVSLKADFPLLLRELEGKLGKQAEALDGKLAQINGERLAKASADCIGAAKRIEGASLAFANLAEQLLGGEALELERASKAGLGADDYAPNPSGERFVGQSRSVAQNETAQADEEALNATSY